MNGIEYDGLNDTYGMLLMEKDDTSHFRKQDDKEANKDKQIENQRTNPGRLFSTKPPVQDIPNTPLNVGQ
jgi:hypothetical protein